jgi:hypothetical protein
MAINKPPAAKRRNAQKTTGALTTGGKAASSFNPLKPAKTLIIGDESAEGRARLADEYHDDLQPANPAEHALVEALIENEWRLRRLRRTEVEIWEQVSDKLLAGKGPDGVVTAGETFAAASGEFVRHQRVVESCERNYHRALKELERLQSKRTPAQGSVLQFPQPPRRTEPQS